MGAGGRQAVGASPADRDRRGGGCGGGGLSGEKGFIPRLDPLSYPFREESPS